MATCSPFGSAVGLRPRTNSGLLLSALLSSLGDLASCRHASSRSRRTGLGASRSGIMPSRAQIRAHRSLGSTVRHHAFAPRLRSLSKQRSGGPALTRLRRRPSHTLNSQIEEPCGLASVPSRPPLLRSVACTGRHSVSAHVAAIALSASRGIMASAHPQRRSELDRRGVLPSTP